MLSPVQPGGSIGPETETISFLVPWLICRDTFFFSRDETSGQGHCVSRCTSREAEMQNPLCAQDITRNGQQDRVVVAATLPLNRYQAPIIAARVARRSSQACWLVFMAVGSTSLVGSLLPTSIVLVCADRYGVVRV